MPFLHESIQIHLGKRRQTLGRLAFLRNRLVGSRERSLRDGGDRKSVV